MAHPNGFRSKEVEDPADTVCVCVNMLRSSCDTMTRVACLCVFIESDYKIVISPSYSVHRLQGRENPSGLGDDGTNGDAYRRLLSQCVLLVCPRKHTHTHTDTYT